MKIKVINAGNCIICGRELKIVTKNAHDDYPDILFCPICSDRMKKNNKHGAGSNEEVKE